MNVKALLDDVPAFRDKFGKAVQRDENRWLLPSLRSVEPYVLDFDFLSEIEINDARGFVLYIRHKIQTSSTAHSKNAFDKVRAYLRSAEYRDNADALTAIQAYRVNCRERGLEYIVHHTRDWFLWCANQYFAGFDDAETRWAIRDLRLPGNPKGVAVLSEDPEEGPLFEAEESALRAALQRTVRLSLQLRVLVWLFLSLGPNPLNLVLLREQDFVKRSLGEQTFYELRVPSIKKRQAYRSRFKVRKIDAFLGVLVEELIQWNKQLHPDEPLNRPLFWRSEPRRHLGEWDEYKHHFAAEELGWMLQEAVMGVLQVVSPITGKPLRINPRRLRYTFATRMVRQGCDIDKLADLLDHSDLQHVLVYFKNRGAIKRIDAATAQTFGPVVNRFMGRIISREEAPRDPRSRIKETINLMDLGTCGLGKLCDLYPPLSCYICPKFHPWKEAPHERFLNDVVSLAEHSPREAVQLNEVIFAIGQVVAACKS